MKPTIFLISFDMKFHLDKKYYKTDNIPLLSAIDMIHNQNNACVWTSLQSIHNKRKKLEASA